MATQNKNLQYVAKSIEKSIEIAEQERRRKLLNHRLEIARTGLAAYQKKQITDAVRAFHSYFRILEEIKGVGEGGLTPAHFDPKTDMAEILMISGIYWDLVKIYDHTRSIEKQRDFKHYLDKYVLFSKGMPFQALCAETLRKYISNEKPIHRAAFKEAYKALNIARCFIATAVFDELDVDTMPTLRVFRDEWLKSNAWGRSLVYHYYRRGPRIAHALESLPDTHSKALLKKGIAFHLDVFAAAIRLAGYFRSRVRNRRRRTT